MDIDAGRAFCLTFPEVTEEVLWGCDLVFKTRGKMFAVFALAPSTPRLAVKSTPERFHELLEHAGVTPSKYLARAHWVSIEESHDFSWDEIKALIEASFRAVREKMSTRRKTTPRVGGGEPSSPEPAKASPRPARRGAPSKRAGKGRTPKPSRAPARAASPRSAKTRAAGASVAPKATKTSTTAKKKGAKRASPPTKRPAARKPPRR